MKWCFSWALAAALFMNSHPALCRDIILVESLAGLESGLLVKKILMRKFQFPEKLITLKIIKNSCEEKSDAIVHLCLLSSGDLQILKLNQYVIKNSFGIFINNRSQGGTETKMSGETSNE